MPRPPHPPKGGKKKNKQLLMVGGGAAAAVAVFALIKRQSASSAADTTAATTGATPTYDSTANDVYNSLENQLGQLQQQIAAIGSQGATNGSTGPSTGTTGGGSTSSGGSATHPGSGGPAAKPPTSGSGNRKISGGNPPRISNPFTTVTVTRGQTLSGIAAAHHETLGTLLKDNPVYTSNPKYKKGNLIFAGDKVKVR